MQTSSFALLAAATIAPLAAAAQDTTLNALFMAQAAYSEDDVRQMTEAFEEANPGIDVELEFVPYEGLHDKTVLATGSGSGYDVVLFDVVWTAEYAANDVLRDVSDRIDAETDTGVLPGAWTTVEYEGARFGMPWILDTKYLFFNRDMMEKAGISEVPRTWSALSEAAQAIKDAGIVEYPLVWSWAQAEAAICDYTTLVDAYGGRFFDGETLVVDQDGGLEALQYMTQSIENGLSNPNSKEFLEEDVRRVFQNGDAAFALNWTYMYALANDPEESSVAGAVGIAPAPGIEGTTEVSAVNGSMGLGITATSDAPDAAWDYIVHMTSQPVQNEYSRLSLPIWESSYSDPAVIEGQEELVAAAEKALPEMLARPMTPRYQELSVALQQAIQEALLGISTPEEALAAAVDNAGF